MRDPRDIPEYVRYRTGVEAEVDARQSQRAEARFREWVSKRGEPTDAGRARILALVDALRSVLRGHLDNCGGSCRIDLDGHDCCAECNEVDAVLRLLANQDAKEQGWDEKSAAMSEWDSRPKPWLGGPP